MTATAGRKLAALGFAIGLVSVFWLAALDLRHLEARYFSKATQSETMLAFAGQVLENWGLAVFVGVLGIAVISAVDAASGVLRRLVSR